MLTLEWNMDDALQARFDEGHDVAMDSVVRNMLRSGMTFDKIQELTQLSFEHIQDIKNTLTK
ncbi:MAG: hypothetical protein IJS54_01100 [Desulfovibrio sp.]|nr:hypothetical protein [Desulfovibrio sp.]